MGDENPDQAVLMRVNMLRGRLGQLEAEAFSHEVSLAELDAVKEELSGEQFKTLYAQHTNELTMVAKRTKAVQDMLQEITGTPGTDEGDGSE